MKLLFDLFPLILFFAAYRMYDIFVATGVAMVAAVGQVAWLKLRGKKIEPMHVINLIVIVVFGGATIVSQNDVFIRWKPTILYWSFAAILIGTHFLARQPGVQYIMGSQMELPDQVWRKMNFAFAGFMFVMGCLNLYVAFVYGADLDPDVQRDHWVNFKVFGTMVLTFAFIIGLMYSISKHLNLDKADSDGKGTRSVE